MHEEFYLYTQFPGILAHVTRPLSNTAQFEYNIDNQYDPKLNLKMILKMRNPFEFVVDFTKTRLRSSLVGFDNYCFKRCTL